MTFAAHGLRDGYAAAALALVLCGCSTGTAPGIGFGGSAPLPTSTEKGEKPTSAGLKEITPEVVKSQQESRSSRSLQDLSALMVPPTPYAI
jgi:hypothetical protein